MRTPAFTCQSVLLAASLLALGGCFSSHRTVVEREPTTATMVVIPGPAPTGQYWYCDDPAGYYPHVTQCSAAWRAITTAPPP
jgi:hypothetical protein